MEEQFCTFKTTHRSWESRIENWEFDVGGDSDEEKGKVIMCLGALYAEQWNYLQ